MGKNIQSQTPIIVCYYQTYSVVIFFCCTFYHIVQEHDTLIIIIINLMARANKSHTRQKRWIKIIIAAKKREIDSDNNNELELKLLCWKNVIARILDTVLHGSLPRIPVWNYYRVWCSSVSQQIYYRYFVIVQDR